MSTPTTKEAFLTAYRAAVIEHYPWAADALRLNRFMDSVRTTLYTPANTWNKDSDVATAVWRAIGCKGPMTYKALKGLA